MTDPDLCDVLCSRVSVVVVVVVVVECSWSCVPKCMVSCCIMCVWLKNSRRKGKREREVWGRYLYSFKVAET